MVHFLPSFTECDVQFDRIIRDNNAIIVFISLMEDLILNLECLNFVQTLFFNNLLKMIWDSLYGLDV